MNIRTLATGNLITCLFIVFSAIAGSKASAQSVGAGLIGSASLVPDNQKNIISFSPVFNAGKTYIRWLVQNDEKDGLFVVERSGDGIDFEAMGFKDRIGSPLCVNLFYSFIDEEPMPGQTWYRIMAVGTDQSFYYSDVVRVRTDKINPAAGTNAALGE
jgi:hypothetical protein